MNLEECRQKINQIDEQMLKLFIKRMETIIEVAKYKQEHNLPILHPKREEEIIRRQTEKSPEILKPYVTELYQTLMKVSRNYQNTLIK